MTDTTSRACLRAAKEEQLDKQQHNDDDGFALDFEWKPALQNLYHGRPEDFCILLRDYRFPVPDKVREFLAKMLEGKVKPPPKKRQRDTMDVWELQAIHVAAIKHLKRKASGMGPAELSAKRKTAIFDLTKRHGRSWDTIEKLFKAELRRLEKERSGTS